MKKRQLDINLSCEILIWARKSVGRSIEDTAKIVGVKPEKVSEWEEGKSLPTYGQLEKLAYKAYKFPIAVFFRNSPPMDEPLKKDLRTLPQSEINGLSTEFRLVIRKAKRIQYQVLDLLANEEFKSKYKDFNVRKYSSSIQAAGDFRKFIGLTFEQQRKWRVSDSFTRFREIIENQGIFVFQFKFPIEEARAFSLFNPLPIIILNESDSKNGRTFSLLHETCHILFNSGGLFRDTQTSNLKQDLKLIEEFCNEFAAEFLLPTNIFVDTVDLEKHSVNDWEDKYLESLSRQFKVSKEVILRKLVTLRLATFDFYLSRKKEWDKTLFEFKKMQVQKNKDKGKKIIRSQAEKTVTERGKLFVNKVLENHERGEIPYSNISELLDVKLDHIPKILERI